MSESKILFFLFPIGYAKFTTLAENAFGLKLYDLATR